MAPTIDDLKRMRRLHPRLTATDVEHQGNPFVPELTPVVDPRGGSLMTRPWLDWARRLTLLVGAAGTGSGGGGTGTGDVVGPASAVPDHVAVYSGTTGKLIKDGLKTIAQIISDAVGAILPGGAFPGGTSIFLRGDGAFAPVTGQSPHFDLTENIPVNPPADIARLYALDVNGYTQVEMKDSAGRGVRFSSDNVVIVKITEPAGVTRGQAVYIAGASGANSLVRLARANDINTMPAIGIVLDAGALNAFTRVLAVGTLQGVDTSAFLEGVSLFVSPTVAGGFTATLPVAPDYAQRVGFVTRSHATQGEILVMTTGVAGPPRVHAPTHSTGGTDPVTVTNLAGYPGGTSNFLRADGTFATPAAGVPGPHHATHEPGGGDAMAVDAAAATGSLRTIGPGPLQATAGNDARLTNARTPTAHATTHSAGNSDPVTVTALAGYPGGTTNFLRADGTFATPTAGVPGAHHLTHEPGGSDPMAVDAVAATGSLRTLGTGAQQATAGNDTRLTNARTPTAHATTHQPGGSDAMAVDAVAATGSLRTLGTGSQQAAAGNDTRFTNARTPTAHATTHQPGGSDPMVVDAAAGSGSLRTLGTGSQQAAAGTDPRFTDARTPTAHQSTHRPGGSDPLFNAAWLDFSNVFVASPQTFQKNGGVQLVLKDPTASPDARTFKIINGAERLYLEAFNDVDADQGYLYLTHSGDVTISRNLTANGSGGNVACKNQANDFVRNQRIVDGSPFVNIVDTNQPDADSSFLVIGISQQLQFWSTNAAASTVVAKPLILIRTGDVVIGRYLYEQTRPYPMGHWQNVSFNAADFTVDGGGAWVVTGVTFNAYTRIGNTMLWSVSVAASTLTGTGAAILSIRLPDGLTTPAPAGAFIVKPGYAADAAGAQVDFVVQVGDATHLQIHRGGNAVPAGALAVYFTSILQVG